MKKLIIAVGVGVFLGGTCVAALAYPGIIKACVQIEEDAIEMWGRFGR